MLLYLHAVEYNPEKIKTAVEIIDHFKATMEDLDHGSDIVQLDKDTLSCINKEYQQFVSAKSTQIKLVKEYSSKMLSQLDEWKMPHLENIMSKYFASTASKDNVCEYCNYPAKNPRALVAHQRGCGEKKRQISEKQQDFLRQSQPQPQPQPQPTIQVQRTAPATPQTMVQARQYFIQTHKDPRRPV